MSVISNHSDESGHHTLLRRKRRSGSGVWLAVTLLPLVGGCSATQLGPHRPITIEEDVANIRILADPDLSQLRVISVADRNQIITARMYIADLEYHQYEAKLTRDLQEEGLAATLTTLGLTSAASLITVASTSRILSGAATVVTGADKAYSDKVLLSNTIQALQTQMRADRQTQGAAIFLKMPAPIDQYTLPMALSDVDKYYQAGTLASALVGLNKTVANAEQNASTAHDLAGPNGEAVSTSKTIANPPPTATRATLTSQAIATPGLMRPPAMRTTGGFIHDDPGDALRNFLRPTGRTGPVDQNRLAQVESFIKDQNFNPVPLVPSFLRDPVFAAKREQLARKLGLIR